MRIAPAVVPLFVLLAASSALAQGEPEKVHVRMHKKIAPSVVYVQGGGQTGSGVCVDKDGYILTSPTACGSSTETVTVLAPGAKSYQGKVVGRNNDKELVIVKIDATIPAVEFADSDKAKAGQVSYVFGDSFGSIVTDDQVAISLGVVSGIYELPKKNQRGTYYTGKVIETSAAVNPNQDGGPLVDGDGRLLGIVTLNYDESKFTGVAIPINAIRDEVLNLIKTHKGGGAAATTTTPAAKAPGYLGVDFTRTTPTHYLLEHAPLTEASYSIEACLPGPQEARCLGIKRAEPCLVMTRRTVSGAHVASLGRLVYPGARYSFSGKFQL